jgi:hypothetical protein
MHVECSGKSASRMVQTHRDLQCLLLLEVISDQEADSVDSDLTTWMWWLILIYTGCTIAHRLYEHLSNRQKITDW